MQPDGAVTIIEITVIRSRELFAFEVKRYHVGGLH